MFTEETIKDLGKEIDEKYVDDEKLGTLEYDDDTDRLCCPCRTPEGVALDLLDKWGLNEFLECVPKFTEKLEKSIRDYLHHTERQEQRNPSY